MNEDRADDLVADPSVELSSLDAGPDPLLEERSAAKIARAQAVAAVKLLEPEGESSKEAWRRLQEARVSLIAANARLRRSGAAIARRQNGLVDPPISDRPPSPAEYLLRDAMKLRDRIRCLRYPDDHMFEFLPALEHFIVGQEDYVSWKMRERSRKDDE